MRRVAVLLLALLGGLLAAAPAPARAEVLWLCHPDLRDDPCEIPLDTTVREPGGAERVVTPERVPAMRRPVDCFYVYPTVSNRLEPNAPKAKDPEIVSIAKFQASRFSTRCRMFAPVYRQVTLAGIPGLALGGGPGAPAGIAYADVREAWRAYLATANEGRGVVVVGHSQGSIMLRRLLREEVEPRPAQRRLVAGALLLGGNVMVRPGARTGGDFEELPTCERPGEARCVVAYSTYADDPGPTTFFGNSRTDLTAAAFGGEPQGPDFEVACTDPGTLSGERGPFGVTVPTEPFATGPIDLSIVVTNGGPPPTAATTWVRPADRFAGGCRRIGDAHVLRYDPVPGARRPNEFPPEWGTHLLDVNLALDERLLPIAGRQAATWLREELAIRRVRRTAVEVAVPGPGVVELAPTRALRRQVRVLDAPRIVVLPLRLRGAGLRALRRDGRVRTRVRVRLRPAVGPAVSVARTVTVVRR